MKKIIKSNLIIGGAQLGLKYGTMSMKISKKNVHTILTTAFKNKIYSVRSCILGNS